MIRKALLTALGLLLIHYAYIKLAQPDWDRGQNLWQENLIKAQHYLYEVDKPSGAVVGSSLSARLNMQYMPENYHNLAMGGLSIYDGLKTILAKKTLPEIVLVESNLINRPASQDFSNSLFSPVMFPLRKYIPSFREENQPVGLLTGSVLSSIKNRNNATNSDRAVSQTEAERQKTDPVYARVLQLAIEHKSKAASPELLNTEGIELKRLLEKLESKGVQIIFFEIPVHAAICDLDFPKSIRAYMQSKFPPSQYHYISQPNCSDYRTTDGEHLDKASADKYSQFLNDQLIQAIR